MKKANNFLTTVVLFIILTAISAAAQDTTRVTIRARAHDAKFIGSSMGGAKIAVINSINGDTLAQGLTKGGTGDTKRLVTAPKERYDTLSTPGAAKFVANIPLNEPTLVTITAAGPMENAQFPVTVSTQQWLIPGRDITGDGIILEVPGFAVINTMPKAEKTYPAGKAVTIKSHIVMMCGCPTSDGGLWDSSEYEIEARIKYKGKLISTLPLQFTGTNDLFSATFTPSKQGIYQVFVYVFHPRTNNSGSAKRTLVVE